MTTGKYDCVRCHDSGRVLQYYGLGQSRLRDCPECDGATASPTAPEQTFTGRILSTDDVVITEGFKRRVEWVRGWLRRNHVVETLDSGVRRLVHTEKPREGDGAMKRKYGLRLDNKLKVVETVDGHYRAQAYINGVMLWSCVYTTREMAEKVVERIDEALKPAEVRHGRGE